MRRFKYAGPHGLLLLLVAIGLVLPACGSVGASASRPSASASAVPTSAGSEPGGGTISGDVPDNAVFLSYRAASLAFSIPYVEGWQVTPQSDGVVIRDKDSSETVAIVGAHADAAGYVASVELPGLRALAGFTLIKQDTFTTAGSTYVHLAFHLTSPPDAVTGKRVPLTVDRYYVPGSSGLAIVSLATPDGVDNVDAFRRMIEGFRWS